MSRIYLARHGETPWSLEAKHTGRSDIPLTPHGEEEARRLGARLRSLTFARVLCSPLIRARRSAELAGYGDRLEILGDLVEWDYGAYEGLRSSEIRAKRADWHLFRDGCPGGERLDDVVARADRVIPGLKSAGGNVLVFAHGHFLRVLAVRWAGIAPESGARFALASGSLSVLSTDGHSGDSVIESWNDVTHLS